MTLNKALVRKQLIIQVLLSFSRIIAALSPEERGLFRERIRFLDKKIHPGLTKLTWASKGISDYFVTECRLHSSKIQCVVDDYKVNIGSYMNSHLRYGDKLLASKCEKLMCILFQRDFA